MALAHLPALQALHSVAAGRLMLEQPTGAYVWTGYLCAAAAAVPALAAAGLLCRGQLRDTWARLRTTVSPAANLR